MAKTPRESRFSTGAGQTRIVKPAPGRKLVDYDKTVVDPAALAAETSGDGGDPNLHE